MYLKRVLVIIGGGCMSYVCPCVRFLMPRLELVFGDLLEFYAVCGYVIF